MSLRYSIGFETAWIDGVQHRRPIGFTLFGGLGVRDIPISIARLAQPIKSLAQRFAYVGLVMVAFGLMLLGKLDAVLVERIRTHVTDAAAPILGLLSRPAAVVSRMAAQIEELAVIRVENARLRADRARLVEWQTIAQRLHSENRSLRRLLNFVPGPDARDVAARVIGDTGGAFAHTLVLNAGGRDGIGKGQAVITGDGLVGRVIGVGGRSSRILLITDLNSRIPVLVEPHRTRAILTGTNADRPRLIHLPPNGTASPGDRVVTSGHAGAFPPGLPVGVVATVSDGGIAVQPFVDRHRLEYVRVVDFGLTGILRPPAADAEGRAESP